MRFALFFFCMTLLATGCTDSRRDERRLTEAEEELARAREHLEEAREKVREAAGELRRSTDSWREEARRETERALEDAGLDDSEIAGTIGKVMEDVGLALQDDPAVEVLDRNELKDLLPNSIEGAKLHNVNSDDSGGFGIHVSHVTGTYEDNRNGELRITIADLGTLRGLLDRSEEWMDAIPRSREDGGWRKTTLVDGHPALLEKRVRRSGKVEYTATMTVAKRFVVRVEGHGDRFDDDFPLNVLEGLRPARLARLAN